MMQSHHLTFHWSTYKLKPLILKTKVSSEIGVGGFGFDFINTDFIFVYVSGRQLIAFNVSFRPVIPQCSLIKFCPGHADQNN